LAELRALVRRNVRWREALSDCPPDHQGHWPLPRCRDSPYGGSRGASIEKVIRMALRVQGRSARVAVALLILIALGAWMIKRRADRARCCQEAEAEAQAAG
jgi:hypothetical protein